jgi:hypothetical protein
LHFMPAGWFSALPALLESTGIRKVKDA